MTMKLPSGYQWIRLKLLHNNKERHQAFILVLTFVVYALFHASRKPLSVVKTVFHKPCLPIHPADPNWCHWKPFHTADWSRLVGSLEYGFLFFYAVAMFPCGHFAERVDLRLFLSAGMALSGLSTVMFGVGYFLDIHSFSYYLFVQAIGGIVQATGWPAVITILSKWFGKGRRGLVMGIWNANTNTGNVVGSLLAGLFVNWQWGASFIVPGVVLLLASYFVFIFLVDQPYAQLQLSSHLSSGANSSTSPLTKEKQTPSYYTDVKTLSEVSDAKERPISFASALCLPNVLAYAFTLFFSKLVSYTFLYWLPNFLASVSAGKVSAEKAAVLSTIFDIGGIVGGVLAGFLSDNVSSDLSISAHDASSRTIYLRAVTCAGMLLFAAPILFWYQAIATSGSLLPLCLLFLCGLLVTGPCALITTAVSADLGTQPSLQGNSKALATVTAIIDGTGSFGAALGPLLTGALVPYGWSAVFLMLIVADLIALLLSVGIASRSYHGLGRVMRLGTLNL
uniref:Sugar phosphate exchanger 3 n=2 Tax=Schistocephalus solidus TaxID=70667 RepID=A0A0X3Q1T2_SCHSO